MDQSVTNLVSQLKPKVALVLSLQKQVKERDHLEMGDDDKETRNLLLKHVKAIVDTYQFLHKNIELLKEIKSIPECEDDGKSKYAKFLATLVKQCEEFRLKSENKIQREDVHVVTKKEYQKLFSLTNSILKELDVRNLAVL